MFLTERQKEVLEAQTSRARSNAVPHQRLGVSASTVNSINTEIFQNCMEALEVMADPEVFAIFRRRFKRRKEEAWDYTRQIRALLNNL